MIIHNYKTDEAAAEPESLREYFLFEGPMYFRIFKETEQEERPLEDLLPQYRPVREIFTQQRRVVFARWWFVPFYRAFRMLHWINAGAKRGAVECLTWIGIFSEWWKKETAPPTENDNA